MRKRKTLYKKRPQFPIIQGNLAQDSETVLCASGTYKTTFSLIDIQTKREIQCVFWSNFQSVEKGQLVAAEGYMKNNCFICKDVKKISAPYKF